MTQLFLAACSYHVDATKPEAPGDQSFVKRAIADFRHKHVTLRLTDTALPLLTALTATRRRRETLRFIECGFAGVKGEFELTHDTLKKFGGQG